MEKLVVPAGGVVAVDRDLHHPDQLLEDQPVHKGVPVHVLLAEEADLHLHQLEDGLQRPAVRDYVGLDEIHVVQRTRRSHSRGTSRPWYRNRNKMSNTLIFNKDYKEKS